MESDFCTARPAWNKVQKWTMMFPIKIIKEAGFSTGMDAFLGTPAFPKPTRVGGLKETEKHELRVTHTEMRWHHHTTSCGLRKRDLLGPAMFIHFSCTSMLLSGSVTPPSGARHVAPPSRTSWPTVRATWSCRATSRRSAPRSSRSSRWSSA